MRSHQEDLIVELVLQHQKEMYFPEGIKGFESIQEYSLISNENESPMLWLESVVFSHVTFPVVDPFLYFPDYRPEISTKDLQAIGLKASNRFLILCLVNISKVHSNGVTINLAAPILINWNRGLGGQVFLKKGKKYSTGSAIKMLMHERSLR